MPRLHSHDGDDPERDRTPPGGTPLEMFHDSRLDWLARYVIIESHRGRSLSEILEDETVVERCDRAARAHLLDMPAVVEALCADAVARVRSEIARGASVRQLAPIPSMRTFAPGASSS